MSNVSASRLASLYFLTLLRTITLFVIMNILLNSSIVFAQLPLKKEGKISSSFKLPRNTSTKASETAIKRLDKVYAKLPLRFEANKGQVDSKVKYISRANGYNLFLAPDEVVLVNNKPITQKKESSIKTTESSIFSSDENTALRMSFVGGTPQPQIIGFDKQLGKSNYFIGNDPAKWQNNVSNYGKVKYKNVYPNIDVIFYGNQQQIEYDFLVAPGADSSQITLNFEGAQKLSLNENGDLLIETKAGEVRQHKPKIFQEVNGIQKFIDGQYFLKGEFQIGFKIDFYDSSKPLIIDPVLSYSSYIGGGLQDTSLGITIDKDGYAYILGNTNSTNFPLANALQPTLAGSYDIYITKLDKKGSNVIYSTYLGGSKSDACGCSIATSGGDITVDSSGNVYLVGQTFSVDFPVTANAYQKTQGGASNPDGSSNSDVFVTKLNSTGNGLIYSTYLGGWNEDAGNGVAIDASGNAYITGTTNYSYTPDWAGFIPFPTTTGAFRSQGDYINRNNDGFVTKLNANGSALIYSTFLGGTESEGAEDIAVDSDGNAFIAGYTFSSNFPTTENAFQRLHRGQNDGFVTKLNVAGSGLIYSTLLGGSQNDEINGIQLLNTGEAYVTGSTLSSNFPLVTGSYQSSLKGVQDAFISKLSADGTVLKYSTYFGEAGNDLGRHIATGGCDSIYVLGNTNSASFPISPGAFQTTLAGSHDSFLIKLDTSRNTLVYSTYIGGSGDDLPTGGIAADDAGNVYIAGTTNSTNYPTTTGAFRTSLNGTGTYDAFITKFNLQGFTNETQPVAPDATASGSNAVTSAEYRFAAAIDTTVLEPNYPGEDLTPSDSKSTGREIEIWAQFYRPTTLATGQRYPLIILLHGNHNTCGKNNIVPRQDDKSDYTYTGNCPTGYSVVLNHMGYDYLATRLASWGYFVISINANRGITGTITGPNTLSSPNYDPALILTRGRLVLKHLQKLSEWDKNGGTPRSLNLDLKNRIDFNNVGLMGHSRGGEGVRAAYNLYRETGSPWTSRILSPVAFKGIFEFAPTDGYAYNPNGTARLLNADGTNWNVVLPMCDGDLTLLPGIKPFDRMLKLTAENPATKKSSYTVWGANHNYYNTEWQGNDAKDFTLPGCIGHASLFTLSNLETGSTSQRETGYASFLAFFRANVGASANPSFNQNFDTLYKLPPVVRSITRVDRGYTPSPKSTVTTIFDDFNLSGSSNTYDITTGVNASNSDVPRHDANQRAAAISWTNSGNDRFFQSNWQPTGVGTDISQHQTLDFRISRVEDALNSANSTNLSIQLVMANGSLSDSVELCKYADLRGPVGGPGGLHPILQTVRIPLADFTNANLSQVRSIRFTFNKTQTGYIYVANIRLLK